MISPRLYRETVNIIRGLELAHDLEVTFDGERILLAPLRRRRGREANYLNPTAAGDELEKRFQMRLPVKAGPHAIGVAFLKKSSAPTVELLQPFLRERIDPITPVGIPELDKVTIEGPFNVTGPGDSPSRRRIFTCRPARWRRRRCPARGRSCRRSRGARIGGRSPTRRWTRLLGFYRSERTSGGTFDAGIENALAFLLVIAAVPVPLRARPRQRRRRTASIASAISSWRRGCRSSSGAAFPTISCWIWPSQGKLQNPAVLEQQVKRMLADERARALGSNFAGQWLYLRNLQEPPARRGRLPGLRRQPAPGPAARNGAALREHRARGPERARPAQRELHVPERAAGAPLRHPERLRRPVPPRRGSRRRPARACWARAASWR